MRLPNVARYYTSKIKVSSYLIVFKGSKILVWKVVPNWGRDLMADVIAFYSEDPR